VLVLGFLILFGFLIIVGRHGGGTVGARPARADATDHQKQQENPFHCGLLISKWIEFIVVRTYWTSAAGLLCRAGINKHF
jgi:hypothetical protein